MDQPKVLPFQPRPTQLAARIREIAKDDELITWAEHSFDRSDQRDISIRDALVVLRGGHIKGDIESGKNRGEWKCKMVKAMKGRREIGVVTIVINDRSLFVKTVEWEDLR